MNPNDLLAQQQALLNEALTRQQHWSWLAAVLSLASIAATAWVLYMFYARLRDIANELRNFRLAFEFYHSGQSASRPNLRAESAQPPEDNSRYMPKK